VSRNEPSSGSSSVTIVGARATAASAFCLACRIGLTASQAGFWISDSSLTTKPLHGSSLSLKSILTVGLTVRSVSQSITYNTPTLGIQKESPGVSSIIILKAGENYVDGTYRSPTGCFISLYCFSFKFNTQIVCERFKIVIIDNANILIFVNANRSQDISSYKRFWFHYICR
jgi:hypothetical protein